MELTRRLFLRWCSLAALGGLSLNLSGCGGKALTGSLQHAPAQEGANPPPRPAGFVSRNDLGAVPHIDAIKPQDRLITLAQLSDIHITLDEFTLTGYPQMERMLDG